MSVSCDAVVVGAGIVGSACALELAQNGLSVCIVDRGPGGGQATSVGMGHVAALGQHSAQLALCAMSQRLWGQVSDWPEAEIERRGMIWVFGSDEGADAAAEQASALEEAGIESRLLSKSELHGMEPQLAQGVAGGLLVPGDLFCYPPGVAARLLSKATALGAQFMPMTSVLHARNGEVGGDGLELKARWIVLACGVSLPELVPSLQVRPRFGELALTLPYPGFISHGLAEIGYVRKTASCEGTSVVFNAQPRAGGQLLIGSSRTYDEGAPSALAQILERAALFVPGAAGLQVSRSWRGARPASPDGLPIIGSMPNDDTLLIAGGHEGLGITQSLGTARLVADMVLGQQSEIDARAFAPERLCP